MNNVRFPSMIVGALLCVVVVVRVANAADLTVTLQPSTSALPQSIAIEVEDNSVYLAPHPPAGYVYTGKLAPQSSQWVTHGLVVARWGARSEPIKLRITQMTPGALSMPLFNYDYSADKGTLDFIDDGKDDLSSYLTRYFVARDVYAQISMPHEIKYRALRLWYDAAYNLATKRRFFAVDEEVISRGAAVEAEAKTNAQIANLLTKINGRIGYFTDNNRQFKWVFYKEIGTIQNLATSKHIEAAQMINDYYMERLNELSPDEQKELSIVHGVTLDTLKKNAEWLKTLLQSQQPVATPFPPTQ